MANRNFPQARVWGHHLMPVSLDLSVSIGASGAPTIESGSGLGIASITRMAAGQYRIRLQDNYAKLLMVNARAQSPVAGGNVAAGSLTPGLVYQITAMGTSTQANWETAGVPAGITAAVGVVFKCAATSSGNGTAALLGASGVANIEIMGNNVNMLNSQPYNANLGGYIDVQCLGPIITMGAYTPAGTISAPIFTGGALAGHTHAIAVAAGTAGDAVTNNAGVLNSVGGEDLVTSSDSAGTPAGTNSVPIFTGSASGQTATGSLAAVDPANGSKLFIQMLLSNSQQQ